MINYVKEKYLKAKAFFTRKQEEGAAMVEYALLVALIALACIIALTQLGTTMSKLFKGEASTTNSIPSNAR
jgi:Flp pilus assembly pilin Flp